MSSVHRVSVRAYLTATHFPQALTMVVLTTLLCVLLGLSGWSVIWVTIATASGQASVGWFNDYLDAQVDKSLDRRHKPVVRHSLNPERLKKPIIVASLLAIPFSFLAAGWLGGIAHLGAIASAQIYNRHLSRTVWSWLPYAVSFALLPIFCWQAASREIWPSENILVIAILVGVIAHIFNALPDLELDRRVRFGGLVVYLGRSKSIALIVVLGLVLLTLLIQLLVG